MAIIDDRPLSRAGLHAMLQAVTPETRRRLRPSVVAESKRAHVATVVSAARPKLLLSGDPSGRASMTVLDAVTRLPSPPAVLVIAERLTEADARSLLIQGAAGVLLLRSAPQHLTWALPAVAEGSRALSPEIADAIVPGCPTPVRSRHGARERLARLSAREREVLALLSDGLSNRAIAQALYISPDTVKDHVRTLCTKLRADNRIHAARIAWQAESAG
ncbi:LuxR C-terminal-related transcriptional regulator [Streptomyces sp. NPDC015684]|uniref:response regulator transcription factor n=1 Tax=Streptomyces sp. NPDC015684 TaxID=3364963 RepID=UPI0036FAD631